MSLPTHSEAIQEYPASMSGYANQGADPMAYVDPSEDLSFLQSIDYMLAPLIILNEVADDWQSFPMACKRSFASTLDNQLEDLAVEQDSRKRHNPGSHHTSSVPSNDMDSLSSALGLDTLDFLDSLSLRWDENADCPDLAKQALSLCSSVDRSCHSSSPVSTDELLSRNLGDITRSLASNHEEGDDGCASEEPSLPESEALVYLEYLEMIQKLPFSASQGEACLFCPQRKYHRKFDLAFHVKTFHLKERKYECDQCHARFKRKGHLQGHIKMIHEKTERHSCCVCAKSFCSNSSMRKHMRALHNSEIYDSA